MDIIVEISPVEIYDSNASWIRGMSLNVPKELLEKYCSETNNGIKFKWRNGYSLLDIKSIPETEKLETVSYLRTVRMFTNDIPLSSKLPFSYHYIPQFLRSKIAHIIGRKKRKNINQWAKFPLFPLDLSVDALSDIFCMGYKKFRPTPVILTHDIDSPEALRNLPMFLDEEESVGAKSTNFVVPFKWKIDHDILSEIRQRGHEIGLHGFRHSNKTPFLQPLEINERIDKMRDFKERYNVIGYRSPSLLRTQNLFQALSEVFKYDSSVPTSGGLFPVPNNGCASARIFKTEGIFEIPISMPRDAALLFLGYKPCEIRDIWFKCANAIRESGGIITLLTHCEKRFLENGEMLTLYRDFLYYIRNDKRFTFRTCEEIYKVYTEGNSN